MLRHRDFRMEKKQLVVLSSGFFHGINKRTTCDVIVSSAFGLLKICNAF